MCICAPSAAPSSGRRWRCSGARRHLAGDGHLAVVAGLFRLSILCLPLRSAQQRQALEMQQRAAALAAARGGVALTPAQLHALALPPVRTSPPFPCHVQECACSPGPMARMLPCCQRTRLNALNRLNPCCEVHRRFGTLVLLMMWTPAKLSRCVSQEDSCMEGTLPCPWKMDPLKSSECSVVAYVYS